MPLPLIIVDSMWMERVAFTVKEMSPLLETLPEVVPVAKSLATYLVIFPVVGFELESVTT